MARKQTAAEFPDPDDMFSESRMTFGEHIDDLRTHLMRAIKGFLLGLVVALIIGKPVVDIITDPVKTQLEIYEHRQNSLVRDKIRAERKADPKKREFLSVDLKLPANLFPQAKRPTPSPLQPLLSAYASILDDWGIQPMLENYWMLDDNQYILVTARIDNSSEFAIDLHDKTQTLRPKSLTTLSIQEAFMVYFKVALMTGLVISSPWVFFQIWSFVAAGLYPHEKKLVNVYLPVSLGLFLGGVLICQFLVMPRAVEALLWFNEWLGIQPDLRLNEWLGFAIFMPLVFGISFQTPMVMLFTFKIGIFGIDTFQQKRRLAWFIMAVFAALITPSTDAFSMLFLWVPMSLLYELGIILCWMQPKSTWDMDEPSESQELVEV